jgi:hypothetical protein
MIRESARLPLVAVLYSVPLLSEAISSALDDIAEVRMFRALRGDTVGLLKSVRPDAVVVDHPTEAAKARDWAESRGVPLVHISLQERKIRLLRGGAWEESSGSSAESIRNVIAGSMFARGGVAG